MQVRLIGGHHHGEKISLEDDELTFPLRMAYPDGPVNYRLEFDVIIASAKVFFELYIPTKLILISVVQSVKVETEVIFFRISTMSSTEAGVEYLTCIKNS